MKVEASDTRTSKVVFRFDGRHNEQPIKDILKSQIKNFYCIVEKIGYNTYQMFVFSSISEEDTFHICHQIQSNSLLCSERKR